MYKIKETWWIKITLNSKTIYLRLILVSMVGLVLTKIRVAFLSSKTTRFLKCNSSSSWTATVSRWQLMKWRIFKCINNNRRHNHTWDLRSISIAIVMLNPKERILIVVEECQFIHQWAKFLVILNTWPLKMAGSSSSHR